MTLRHLISTSITGLMTHKSRSLLTILGIVIGITAIIMVMSLGRGAQNLIIGQIQSVGAKLIAIVPGRQPRGPTRVLSTFTDSLKQRDLDLLQNKANVPHAARVIPLVMGSQSVAAGNETYQPTIFGSSEEFAAIYDVYPERGRLFSREEARGFADVALIGATVEKELFGAEGGLNQKIRIKGRNLRVIGVLGKTGQVSFLNFDEAVFMPYTTAQQHIFGIKHYNRIAIEADSEDTVEETVKDIQITLRNSHSITDPAKDDFFVQTQAEALATVQSVTGALTLFLTAVAAISLVVGGIGIMNIMLVSVTERTREIGLRKAVGATERNILTQFLLEAVMLTGAGGAIGIALGAGLSFVIALVLSNNLGIEWEFILPPSSIALGFGVSSGIGLLFGIYPAVQAGKKNPIEALRYE